MKRLALLYVAVALLVGCGGGTMSNSLAIATTTPKRTLVAAPAGLSVNLLGGTPKAFTFDITSSDASSVSDLQWSATNLSFLSASVDSVTAQSAALTVTLVGAGTSTITVRDAMGAYVAIPITSIPCGRPDIITYAALLTPANGQQLVPLATRAFYVEVAGIEGQPSPFEPALHAHIVVNHTSTVDIAAPLSPATPPPNTTMPLPSPQPGESIGYESGTLPQLDADSTYTIYLYSDTCEAPWNAGSFST